jgi:hypothetical protein
MKMLNIILLIAVSVFFSRCSENNNETDEVHNSEGIITQEDEDDSSKIMKFIPNHYRILKKTFGDLNYDGISDAIIVIHKIGENYSTAPKRPLMVLLKSTENEFEKVYQSENLIYTIEMGGVSSDDPFSSIKIDDGKFTIEHVGGMGNFSWIKSISFRFSEKDSSFYLIKYIYEEILRNDTSAISHEVLKTKDDLGFLKIEHFNIFEYE